MQSRSSLRLVGGSAVFCALLAAGCGGGGGMLTPGQNNHPTARLSQPSGMSVQPVAVNSSGEVVGYTSDNSAESIQGIVWPTPDSPVILTSPEGSSNVFPVGVSNSGGIVGVTVPNDLGNENGAPSVYYWSTATGSPQLVAQSAFAVGINGNGTVAGDIIDLTGGVPDQGFVWSGGNLQMITVPGQDVEVVGINNAGQVLGMEYDRSTDNFRFQHLRQRVLTSPMNRVRVASRGGVDSAEGAHVFVYDTRTRTMTYPQLGSDILLVVNLNDRGQILGARATSPQPTESRGGPGLTWFLWTSDQGAQNITLPSGFAPTGGLNNRGWIGGDLFQGGVDQPAIYENGTFVNIDQLPGLPDDFRGTQLRAFGDHNLVVSGTTGNDQDADYLVSL